MCAVCYDPMDGTRRTETLTCGHQFHAECLRRCLELRASCPYCRAPCDASRLLSTAEEVLVSRHLSRSATALARVSAANPGSVTYLDGEEERFPLVVLAAQRTTEFWRAREASLARLEETVIGIATAVCRNSAVAQSLSEHAVAELVTLGPHTFLYTRKALLVHRWQSPEAAVRFRRAYQRVWSAIAEHHLCIVRAPTMFAFMHEGSHVTAACVPRVAPGFPAVGLPDIRTGGMTAHFVRLLLAAIGLPPDEPAAMFHKGQGNHVFVVDVAGVLSASLPTFTAFPHVIARPELEWHAGWSARDGTQPVDAFVRDVALSRALDRLVDPVLHLDQNERHREEMSKDYSNEDLPAAVGLAVETLVLERRLATQLHASGVSFVFLEDARKLALHRAALSVGPAERRAYNNIAAAATLEMLGRAFKSMARVAMHSRESAAEKAEEVAKLARRLNTATFWTSSLAPAARAKYGYDGNLPADLSDVRGHSRVVLAVALRKLGLPVAGQPKQLSTARTAFPCPCVYGIPEAEQRRMVRGMWEAALREPDPFRAEAAAVRATVGSILSGLGAEYAPVAKRLVPMRTSGCDQVVSRNSVDFLPSVLFQGFTAHVVERSAPY